MNKDIDFIKQCLDNYFNYHQKELIKWEIEKDSTLWEDFSCKKSNLSMEDINEYEDLLLEKLPNLFKLFLQTYYFSSPIQIRNEDYTKFYKENDNHWELEYKGSLHVNLWILELPEEDTLRRYKEEVNSWNPLLSAGYIPFAEWQDGQGPVCFDVHQKDENGDYAIVWFDHEYLIDLGEDKSTLREEVLVHANPLFNSFRELLEVMFCNREIF